jgi:tetratricopeptide (TPR) repeat protein
VHRTLRLLVRQLPAGRSPSELRLSAIDGEVVAQDGEIAWNPESGQMLLGFFSAASTPVQPLDRAIEGPEGESPDALVNRGRMLQELGDLEEAVACYHTALEVDPTHAIAAFNLGTALDASGLIDEAVASYRAALNSNPALADAHYNLSLLYQRSGHKLAAMIHLKRYQELLALH